jgi:trans-aconitate 2-methyltransferase
MADPRKDFAPIQGDFAFFVAHSTEADSDLDAYADRLGSFAPGAGPIRVLDFGCGPGTFTARLLDRLGWGRDRVQLALVEPVDDYRRQAVERLQGRVDHPIDAWPALPDDPGRAFDVIVSNHVFYYVPGLDETLAGLLGALGPGGIFLAAIASRDNALIDLWFRSFPLIGLDVPYQTAEDVEAALARLGRPFGRREVRYDLTFPDSEENRLKILRFLLGAYFDRMPRAEVLALFEPYASAGRISMHTGNVQYAVAARP